MLRSLRHIFLVPPTTHKRPAVSIEVRVPETGLTVAPVAAARFNRLFARTTNHQRLR